MFIQIQDKSIFDSRFIAYAELMSRLQQEHDIHKHTALKIRMEMIGRSEEERLKYTQRSNERQYIDAAYRANGWSSDVVESSRKAYEAWKYLKETDVPEYMELAEQAPVSMLKTIGVAGKDSTLGYDLARYLSKNNKLPSCKAVEAAAQGRTNREFEYLRGPQLKQSVAEVRSVSGTELKTQPVINVVSNSTVGDKPITPAESPTATNFKTQQENIAELISDETKPHLTDFSSANVYHSGGRLAAVRACTQHISEISIMSPEMTKAVDELFHAVISLKGRSPSTIDVDSLPLRNRR